MKDPLNDPDFPDRPSHPDFWRLSETAMKLDGQSLEGGVSPRVITLDYVDLESAVYHAEQRTGILMQALGFQLSKELELFVTSIYVSGIVHGIAFEKAGGKR